MARMQFIGLLNHLFFIFCLTIMAASISTAQNSPRDFLNAHNNARAAVRVQRMIWDRKVAKFARDYASRCEFRHSGGPYGENLAFGRPDITGEKSVRMWVDEKNNYNCRANTCLNGECGHYTQVVWHDSVRLGCARVKCGDKGTIVVCNYHPPGNIRGQRPYKKCLNFFADSLDKFLHYSV